MDVIRLMMVMAVIGLASCDDFKALDARSSPAPSTDRSGKPARLLTGSNATQMRPMLATATATEGPVDVQLLCERNSITPGGTLRIGLRIRHDKGYHTYWKFPGVIGLPTSIRWALPRGFSAGRLQWAHPQKTKMAVYTVWGYEEDTVLMTEITAPKSARPGQLLEVRADAQWMACKQDCNPGYKSFYLRIPISSAIGQTQTWAPLFQKTVKGRPTQTSTWSFHAEPSRTGFRIIGTPGAGANRTPKDIYFFNSNEQVDSNRSQRFQMDSQGRLIGHLPKWEHAEPTGRLEGILSSSNGWEPQGKARSIHISAPLRRIRSPR
jgi:DsbC/DsbD-like thiol-disulfide interchange protein